jgi:hypothetical protein
LTKGIPLTAEDCVSGKDEYELYVVRPKAELDRARQQQINVIIVMTDDELIDKVTFIVNLYV